MERLLDAAGVDRPLLAEMLEDAVPRPEVGTSGPDEWRPLTSRAQKILRLAGDAEGGGSRPARPVDVLRAMLREEYNVAGALLRQLGVREDA